MVHVLNSALVICIVVLLLCKDNLAFRTGERQNRHKIEVYNIEHELSMTQARNSALTIDLESIIAPPGCQECTKDEKAYCLSDGLITDHCCCDKRHEEVLPYVPHTCYLGTEVCETIIGDCAEYSRLRECCCDKFTKEYWKDKLQSSISRIQADDVTYYLAITLFMYYLN